MNWIYRFICAYGVLLWIVIATMPALAQCSLTETFVLEERSGDDLFDYRVKIYLDVNPKTEGFLFKDFKGQPVPFLNEGLGPNGFSIWLMIPELSGGDTQSFSVEYGDCKGGVHAFEELFYEDLMPDNCIKSMFPPKVSGSDLISSAMIYAKQEKTQIKPKDDEPSRSMMDCNCTASQGGVSYPINALQNAEDDVAFYQYGTPNGASANTGLEVVDASILFLYENTLTGEISLFVIHDAAPDPDGGRASIDFYCLPSDATLDFSDDNGEITGIFPTVIADWRWVSCCTDGALIGNVGCDNTFDFYPEITAGIDSLVWVSGTVASPIYYTFPNINEPVRITCEDANPVCCPDGTTAEVDPESCPNAADGEIVLDLVGTAPFTFAWSTGATTQNISGLTEGTYTVTITDDENCEQILEVEVELANVPELVCPTNITIDYDCDTAEINLSDLGYTIDYDCPNPVDVTCGGCGIYSCADQNSTVQVKVGIQDEYGNDDACTINVFLSHTPPEIICPADATVNMNAACNYNATPARTGTAEADGDCPVEITYEDNLSGLTGCSGTGTIVRTWILVDECDNKVTCEQNILVRDVQRPTITCPADVTINVDAACEYNSLPAVTGNPTGDDNCSDPTFAYVDDLSGLTECAGTGTIVRTWTATDACGNTADCTQNIVVQDITLPTITCPVDATINLNGSCVYNSEPAITGSPILADNCDDTFISYADDLSGLTGCNNTGNIVRTWTVTDACGNTASCDQNIMVQDVTRPAITCPADITIFMDAACDYDSDPANTGSAMGTDNCDPPTITYNDNLSGLTGCSGTGDIIRTWTATDDCGNLRNCRQTITVEDMIPPSITCPMDLELEVGDPTNDAQIATWLTLVTGLDNCGSVSFTNDFDADGYMDGCGAEMQQMVTFTATDDCGNMTTCMGMINIGDMTPPVITCPSDLTIECADPAQMALITAWLATASATDAGGSTVIIVNDYFDPGMFTDECGLTGEQEVLFTATDECGLMSMCMATIVIEDTTPPSISCPADTSIDLNGSCGFNSSPMVTGMPTGMDDCLEAALMYTYEDDESGLIGCNGTGTIERTWTATDNCGNFSTCIQFIELEDNTDPTISCPADVTIDLDAFCTFDNNPTITGEPTVNDNCPDVTTSFSDDLSGLLDCSGTGEIERTWTATDACGNTATCVQIITVQDVEDPNIICPPDVTILMDDGCAYDSDPSITGEPEIDDNCPGATFTFVDDLSGLTECSGTGDIIRTWTVTDACGNFAECTQTITVVDLIIPGIMCPPDAIINLDGSCNFDSSPAITGEPMTIDNCPGVTTDYVDDLSALVDCNGTGAIIREWIVTDACGNSANCFQLIIVQDVELPTINCPADATIRLDAMCTFDSSPMETGSPILDDNCPGSTSSFVDDESGLTDCSGTGEIIRIWTVTDACGNTATCAQTITVVDSELPTIVCPADATIDLDAMCDYDSATTITGEPSVDDNCPGATFDFSDDLSDLNDCSSTGDIIRTWTVTDACGNMSTCYQTITVQDVEDPTVVCPADVTIEFNADCALDTTLVDIGSPILDDNCMGLIFNYSDDLTNLSECGGTGFFERTFIVTDACGNTSNCVQVVTVEDNMVPSIVCPVDFTVDLDASCEFDSDPMITGSPTGDDNCSTPTFSFLDDESRLTDCSGTGTIIRTWTATDACGNTSTCVQLVEVEDNEAPSITCPADTTVDLDAACEYDIDPTITGEPSIDDNCPGSTFAYVDDLTGLTECSGTGTVIRTWTVTDACGNITTCNQDIVIQDIIAPTITCPADATIDLDGTCGYDSAPMITGEPTIDDNCPDPTFAFADDLSGLTDCNGTGTIVRTWTVTDACGNTATCTQDIFVQDVTSPTITCPADATIDLDASCAYDSAPAVTGSPTIADNCMGSTFAFVDDLSGLTDCSGTGTIVRTWTVSDACGSTATCTQDIVVQDVTVPTITCPADATIDLDANCMYDSNPTITGEPTIDDNCPGSTFAFVDDLIGLTECSGTGTIVRTWTVTDACGNTANCTQDIVVQDVTVPTITCPADATVDLDMSCTYDIDPMITGEPTIDDNCPASTFDYMDDLSGLTDCSGTGTIVRIWTVTDACGNIATCTQDILVQDAAVATIVCPADVTIDLDMACMYDSDPAITGNPSIDDNCPGSTFAYADDLSGLTDCSGTGTILRTWTVTDVCGNTATCIQDIVVQDVTIPTITCPADVTVNLDGACNYDIDPMITGEPTIDDNCPGSTFAYMDDITGLTDCSGTGTILRTWTVTDACGNTAICIQDILIQDVEVPTIVCPADVTVDLDGACNYDIDPMITGEPTIADNCPGSTFAYMDDLTGLTDCSETGTIVRTWTVTDACGNTATCTQDILIQDVENPTITCPADVTIEFNADCSLDSTLVDIGAPVIDDNCMGSVFEYSDDLSGLTECSGTGSFIRNFIVTDACGNTETCSQMVIVEDNTVPSITCPADVTIDLDFTCDYFSDPTFTGNPTGADNCSTPSFAYVDDESGLTGCSGTGVILRTWTATDICGNTNTCVQSITVEDNQNPIIYCPDDVTVNLDADCNYDISLGVTGFGDVEDNCMNPIFYSVDDLSGLTDCSGTGVVLRTWTAEDECGNTSTCIQRITIQDIEVPTIVCPANVTVQLNADCSMDTTLVDIGAPITDDNCPGAILEYSDDLSNLTGCGGSGTVLRTFTITDACGNSASCVQNILVENNIIPSITCPADVTVQLDAMCEMDTTTADIGMPIVIGGCNMNDVNYVNDLSGLSDCNGTGSFTRTFTVDDGCGNSSSCTQTIVVEDTTAPSITCPADVTLDLDADCAYDITPANVGNPTGMDNCSTPIFTYEDMSTLTGCSGTGSIVRTWTATDDCGNKMTCVQNITIQDVTDPTITCPSDVTLDLDADCAYDITPANTGEPITDDNCPGSSFSFVDDVTGLTGCSGTGTVIRTWTVIDVCGNSVSCDQVIVIQDSEIPAISCPAAIIVEYNVDCSLDTMLVDIGSPVIDDNCPGVSFTYSDDLSGLIGCGGAGSFVRNFVVTDACGNSAACAQVVIVENNVIPDITCPADVTVQLNAMCAMDTTTTEIGMAMVMGGCNVNNLSYVDDVSGLSECSGTGTFTRTFTVDDGCGNINSCVQTVTVEDTIDPSITCPADVTIDLDGDCNYDIDPMAIGNPTGDDNCSTPDFTYTDDLTALTGCSGTGVIVRTWTATDACGNETTCTQNILIQDVTEPTITCPVNATIDLDGTCGFNSDPAITGNPTIDDNCPGATFDYVDDLSGLTGCNDTGVILRTWTVTDACGNIATCVQDITVQDVENPSIVCPADITVEFNVDCSLDTTLVDVGAPIIDDNCPGSVFEYSDDLSGLTECGGSGLFIRNFLVTDACGNTATCAQTITVEINVIPMITCPADVTVQLDAMCAMDTTTTDIGLPIFNGGCNVNTISYVDDVSGLTECGGTGNFTRTFTVDDGCGNTSNCIQTIVVEDNVVPTILCPANVIVDLDADCNYDIDPSITGSPTGDDNCSMPTFSYVDDLTGLTGCASTGVIARTWTVSDACGNTSSCLQEITIRDVEVPTITCPADVTIEFNEDCTLDSTLVDIGTPIIDDNCMGSFFEYSDDLSGLTGCGGSGFFVRNFTVTDDCGNTATCAQTINVEINVIPSISCPADVTVQLDAMCAMDTTTTDIGMPIVSGGCNVNLVTYVDDVSGLTECGGTGSFTRTFTVDDGCGNSSSCDQVVTVEDNVVPTITCPVDMTVDLDADCTYNIDPAITGNPTGDDNCSTVSFSYTDELAGLTGCSNTGVIMRTWIVSDACVNTSSCIQAITIQDVEVPTITCPMDVTIDFNEDCTLDSTLVDIGSPMIDDNCMGASFAYSDDLSGLTACGGSGFFVRNFTVTDACGNTATCAQTINVEINVIPSIACPADVTVQLDAMCAMDTTTTDIGMPIVTGGCNVNLVTYVDDVSGLTECGGTGSFIRTFTVDDGCGNSSSCNQVVTVQDNVVPTITCPVDVTVDLHADCMYDIDPAITGNPMGDDNCSAVSFSYTDELAGLTGCSNTGVIMRTWIVSDACANTSSCIQAITIQDVEVPTITCPTDVTVEFNVDCTLDTTLVNIGSPMIDDNCMGASFAYSDDLSGLTACGGSGFFVRNFTVTDACGNTSTCAQTITVEINVIPSITCPADVTVQLDAICAMDTTTTDIGMPIVTGGCNVNVVTYVDDVSGLTECGGTGSFIRTFTVDDGCGNSSSCNQVVTVEDNVVPTITCPVDVTVDLDADCMYDIDPAITGNPTGDDNCSDVTFDYSDDLSGLTGCSNTGVILRTWVVTDACANTSSCLQEITIQDVEIPTITCPIDVTVEFNTDCTLDTTLVDIGGPMIDDNCMGAMFSYTDDLGGLTACGGSGFFTRIFTVTDACGNSATCAQNIVVEINVVPVITCPTDVTVELNAMCAMDTTTTDIGLATAIGGCNVNTITYTDDVTGLTGCGGTGSFTRTFVVDDGCGNSSSCTQSIVVEDNIAPIISGVSDFYTDCTSDFETEFSDWLAVQGGGTATDNCSNVVWSTEPAVPVLGTDFDADGATSVTFIATDDCGNTSSYVAEFHVSCLAVAKEVMDIQMAASGIPGNFDVTYSIIIENVGNVDLNNLSLVDDLTSPGQLGTSFVGISGAPSIVSSTATTDPVLDSAYDGTSGNPEMFDTTSGLLSTTEYITLVFTAEVDPDAQGVNLPIQNTATVSATDPFGNRHFVDSSNGDDPEGPKGPTPLTISSIHSSKTACGFAEAASGTPGNYDVQFSIAIQNTGTEDLTNLSLVDDLSAASQFGNAFIDVTVPPAIASSNASVDPGVNNTFDGSATNPNLLDGMSGLLQSGEIVTITFTVEIDPNIAGAPNPMANQATAGGTGPDGGVVQDFTDSGTDPDGNNPDGIGDTGGHNDPSLLILPGVSVFKNLVDYANATDGIPGHFDLILQFGIKNVGNVPMTNIDLFEDLGDAANFGPVFFGVASGTAPMIVSSTATVDPLINASYDGQVTNPNIFDGNSGILDAGEEIIVEMRVTLDGLTPMLPDTIHNLAIGGGDASDLNGELYLNKDGDPFYTDDPSDTGDEFESNNLGEVGDTGGHNDPTCIPLLASVGDYVWKDLDGDGIQEMNEPGLENVTVRLYDCDGNLVNTTETDGTGYYIFEFIIPGSYYIDFDISNLPLGCEFTFQDVGIDEYDSDADRSGRTECFDLAPAEYNPTIDAGVLPLAKVGDYLWHDCNGNGLQDEGEDPMPFMQVNLYDGDGNFVDVQVTDVNGNYLFEYLYPGEYYLEFITNDDFSFTFSNIGNNEATDSDVNDSNGPGTTPIIDLSAGECDLNSGDAGFYSCIEIGDMTFFDTNLNNVWDGSENGVNGLKVILYREMPSGDFIEWDITYSGHKPGTPSDDGYFKFCAPPGSYYIEFAQPPYGMVPALANQGNFEEIDSDVTGAFGAGTTDAFTVSCDAGNCDIGAGYYPMGTVGDFVWLDSNQNGLREPGEAGVANVVVQAFDQSGTMVGMDNTDGSGNYMIDYLQATDVFLKFIPPSGYASTIANASNDSVDSDIDHSNGSMTTAFYEMVSGEHRPNVDAGLILGAVPVEWINFTGESKDNHHALEWTVASQINVSHYEVERSLEGSNEFTSIGRVLAVGSSSEILTYNYNDYDVQTPGLYYYRISQHDLDGHKSYTNVIVIEVEAGEVTKAKLLLYPNPLVDELTIEIELPQAEEEVSYELQDSDGKLVRKQVILSSQLNAGKHMFYLDMSDLSAGTYVIRVRAGDKLEIKPLIVVDN